MMPVELCGTCCAHEEHVMAWVLEAVLEPVGAPPQNWRFGGESRHRARLQRAGAG